MDFYFRDRVGNKTFVSQLTRVNAASHHYWLLCLSTQTMNQVIEDIDAAGECAVELGLLEQFIWNHCRVSVGGSVFFGFAIAYGRLLMRARPEAPSLTVIGLRPRF